MKFSDLKRKYEINPLVLDRLEIWKEKNVLQVHDTANAQKDGFPMVFPITETNKQIFIACPYCNQIHVHGKPEGVDDRWRLSHCKSEDLIDRYYIGYIA